MENHPLPISPGTEKEIEELNAQTFPTLKGSNLILAVLALAAGILLFILAFYLKDVTMVLAALSLGMIWLIYYTQKARHDFMRRFAMLAGMEYSRNESMEGIDAPYLEIGNKKSVCDIISGKLDGIPVKIFNFSCLVGEGKTQKTVSFTVARIDCKTRMPHIFLDSRHHFWEEETAASLDRISEKGKRTIALEGDFNKYFTLFVPEGDEIEALQIFTPDIMAELIDNSKMFSLEFYGGNIYIYAQKTILTGRELYSLYRLAHLLADKIAPKLGMISR